MHTCNECKEVYPADAMAQFGQDWVCARCKPLYVQKLKEGLDGMEGYDRTAKKKPSLAKTVIRTYGVVYLIIALFSAYIGITDSGVNAYVFSGYSIISAVEVVLGIGLFAHLRIMKYLMPIITSVVFFYFCREWQGFLGLGFILVIPTVFMYIPERKSENKKQEIEQGH